MSTIFDMMEQMEGLDLDVDLIGGTNLRLRTGETTTFPIENRTGYITLPKGGLSLTRLTVSDQKGMPVIRCVLGLQGEEIGLLGDSEAKSPLPVYHKAAFTTWRTWIHLANAEFMNPDPAAVKALQDLCMAKNFQSYQPRTVVENPYVRAEGTSILFDFEAPGTNISNRFSNGVMLDSVVLVPDMRIEPNLTEYVTRAGVTEQRPAFTSFIDSITPNTLTFLKASATDDAQAKRTAGNRLSVLTGHNVEKDWPLRPTLGYVTPIGHDEISLFADRIAAAATTEEPSAPPADDDTTVPPVSEEPFAD